MASFKALILSFVIIFSFARCEQKVSKAPASGIPQMSKEEGSIITKREISLWEYTKNKQYDRLREIMADDYIAYFATGNMQPSDVINQLRRSTFTSYHLSNITVKPVADNVAVIYYNVIQDVTAADGQKWLPQVAASSVYVKRNGTWYSVFYQEMPR